MASQAQPQEIQPVASHPPSVSRYRSTRKAAVQAASQSQPWTDPSSNLPSFLLQRSRSRYHRAQKTPRTPDHSIAAIAGLGQPIYAQYGHTKAQVRGDINTDRTPPFIDRDEPQVQSKSRILQNPAQVKSPERMRPSQEGPGMTNYNARDTPGHASSQTANKARQRQLQGEIRTQKEEAKAERRRNSAEVHRQQEEDEWRQLEEASAKAKAEKQHVASIKNTGEEELRIRGRERLNRKLGRPASGSDDDGLARTQEGGWDRKHLSDTAQRVDDRTDLYGPRFRHPDEFPSMRRAGSKELFGFLKRKKGGTVLQEDSVLEDSQVDGYRQLSTPKQSALLNSTSGTDAPISAVNAGDRHVIVEAGKSSVLLPVSIFTTPVTLICSASTYLNKPINANDSVLIESFGKVGIQRPLRKYEHVRDVMNSWDADRQNTLILVDSANEGGDRNLDASSVVPEQPKEFSCQLYYSRKPSKWNKRFVTLRTDGQILVAKKASAKEKDQTNACRLTDFDIYSLAPRRSRVPRYKKHTFVVKSQQKSAMFESIEDYVHCFATSDKRLAAAWYRAVQGWRSWYLVNVLGEGRKKAAVGAADANHVRSGSGTSHYQLGSFKPLVDFDTFGASPSADRVAVQPPAHNHSPPRTGAKSKAPPSSFQRYSSNENDERPITRGRRTSVSSVNSISNGNEFDDGTFAPSGLLGRKYSQRQKQAPDSSARLNSNGPFIGGGLLENTYSARPSVATSTDQSRPDPTYLSLAETSGVKRSASITQRDRPKPLVDLTPSYQPPPQFSQNKKGKGYYPGTEELGPGGTLIDAATSPDLPEVNRVPPANDWRAKARPDEVNVIGGSLLARSNSRRRPGNLR